MAKVGRRTQYDEKFCDQLIKHMEKGYSFASFAGVVSVSRETIYVWVDKHPEFAEAKELGFAKCLLHWESLALAGVMTKDFNTGVFVFNMKNRFGWKDTHEHKIEEKDPSKMSKQEILDELAKINSKIGKK